MTDIRAVRIVKTKYASQKSTINGIEVPEAFSGYGASLEGGRWNSAGVPVVYLSTSQAEAILEVVVHLESERLLKHFSLFDISFDDSLVTTLQPKDIPSDYRADPPSNSTKQIGDDWIQSQNSLILAVPSAIVTDSDNYLINPYHPDLHKLKISGPYPYPIDPRIKRTSKK